MDREAVALSTLMAAHPWADTPLGERSRWPRSLAIVVDMVLNTRFAMCICWGPDLRLIYNDEYVPFLGSKHPAALGQPLAEVWADVWGDIAPLAARALAGEAVAFDDLPLTMHRHGYDEPTWWTFSYSPLRDDTGAVAGFLNVTTETTARVLAERRLVAERERLEQLFQQAPSFMAMLEGPDHRITLANEGYLALVGRRDVVGHTVAEVLGDAVEQGYVDLLDRTFATGEPYHAAGALYAARSTPSGPVHLHYVDFVFQPIRDHHQQVTGIFVQGVDVTDRTREERRRDALERIGDVIRTETDATALAWQASAIVGVKLGASRAGYSSIDHDSDTLVTERDWMAPGIPSLAGRLAMRDFGSFIDDMKRNEMVAIADARTDPRTRDAIREPHALSFLNVPMVENDRLVAMFFVTFADVHEWTEPEIAFVREAAGRIRTATERLHAERAREQAVDDLHGLNASLEERIEERSAALRLYHDIVQSDAAPICAFDTDYRLIAFNQAHSDAFFRVYGHRVQIGEVFPDLFLPDQASIMRAFMTRALAGEAFTVTEAFGDPARVVPYWEVTYNPLRTEDGRVVGAFHHAIDITDRLRAQAELAATQDALRQAQKMEAVGQLTGGLAHDFNNLLTGMMGNLELLQMRLARGRMDDLDRFILAAQGAGRRAASLTQRLLAFSRRQTLDPRPTDVNRLIAGMEDLLRRTVGPASDIEIVGAAGLWTANIDGGQLENALLNLCINGRDAMPEGGRLTIETANKWLDERGARERDLTPGQYLSVCVTDTGTGMSADTIERAFEPFFTTKPLGEGTGLGLSMIYGFARQSNGQVRIYSELGVGTTICIYLPRFNGDAVELGEEASALSSSSASGETILVVDDEATIRHLIDEVLDDAGYTVIGAADGAAGLKVLQSGARIELLITDVGLPGGMNGRQVADAARVLRPGLKVLFITGYAENAAVGNGFLDAGMELLTKPFTMEALSTKVADMMATR